MAAALLVTAVVLAVVAWPALEPKAPELPPAPATAIRPQAPEPRATPTPARAAQPVPGGFERRDALADTQRVGGRVGALAYVPVPPAPRPRATPPPPAPTTAPVVYAPAHVYSPPPHREFSTFEH